MTDVSTPTADQQIDFDLDAEWVDPFDTSYRRQWLLLALIIFLALASYFQTPLAGLMWNDDANIRLNENFITFPTLIARWLHPRMDPVYQPMTASVFWLEYKVWEGNDPIAYHI